MPILRRVLLLFARLAAVHHRRRRRSRHDTALLGGRGARRNALRGRSMRRPGGRRGHVDVVLHLPPAAGCLPCLHARRPRMPGRTQKLRPGAVDLKFPSVPRLAVPAIPSTAESSASGVSARSNPAMIPVASGRLSRMLLYRCPTTHRQVTSEVETTAPALARLGTLKLSLWCPHCGSGHIVCASDVAVWTGAQSI
jgi:hypothetical protein